MLENYRKIFSTLNENKGEIKGKGNNNRAVVSIWKDKRDVRMISTKHCKN